MWFSEACESVEVGYVRVCLRYSHTLSRNASLLITLLRSGACNLTKQILPHWISLCSTCAHLYISFVCVCVCVCACLMCLNLLCLIFVFEWVAMCGWYLYAPLFYIYILHCLLPALCVCVIFCIEGLGLWKFNLNWTHYCLEHQAVFIIFYFYLIDSTAHTHSDIIIRTFVLYLFL